MSDAPDGGAAMERVSSLYKEVQIRMLASQGRYCRQATVIGMTALGVLGPLAYFQSGLGEALRMSSILVVFVVLPWADYALTRYRIKKGYLGSHEHEAAELLEFLARERSAITGKDT